MCWGEREGVEGEWEPHPLLLEGWAGGWEGGEQRLWRRQWVWLPGSLKRRRYLELFYNANTQEYNVAYLPSQWKAFSLVFPHSAEHSDSDQLQ